MSLFKVIVAIEVLQLLLLQFRKYDCSGFHYTPIACYDTGSLVWYALLRDDIEMTLMR